MKFITIVMLCCVFAPFLAAQHDANSRMKSKDIGRHNLTEGTPETRRTPSPTSDERQLLNNGSSTSVICSLTESSFPGCLPDTLLSDNSNVRHAGPSISRAKNSIHASSISSKDDIDRLKSAFGMFEMGPATPSHLDRMDQKLLPLDGKAWHLPDGGERVTVFVLDTGLRLTHFEFRESNGIQVSSRVSCGLDTTFDSEGLGRKCVDMDGHGTAVAALIGGRTLGVAKAVRIVSVKLIDVDGWIFPESAMDGLNYVLSQKRANPSTPMVVNLSWGFFDLFSWHGNKIIRKLVEANVTVVAAAGNEDQNACWHSPSQVDSAIAVGYSDPKDDTFSPDSNHGPCVDIIAPGVNLYSACSYKTHSGSSLAAPLVAGTAALYLQQHPTWTPAQVWAAMERDAVRDVIQNIRGAGTPNLLIQTGPITAAKEEKECLCIAEPISADTGNVAARGLWLQLWPLAVYTQWWTLYMRDVPPQPAERGNCQN